MTPHPRTLATTAVVMCLLLTGCTSDPTPTTSGTPSASAPASASASPSVSASPSSTLPAAERKAIDQATAVVLARAQMITDIPADPEPYLNAINAVSAQPQLDLDLSSLQDALIAVAKGELVFEATGPVTLAKVEPIKVDLEGEPPTVTLAVCVDRSAVRGRVDGKPTTGPREEALYRVVKTTYLPDPGWAVAQVLPPKGFDQPQPC